MSRKGRNSRAPTPGQVWEAWDRYGWAIDGYYVSAPGNIDCPVAYVDAAWPDPPAGFNAKQLAKAIAADRSVLDRSTHVDAGLCVDLRRCSGLYCAVPVPGFVYGLRCRPLDGAGPAVEPRPFCREMFEVMADISGHTLMRQVQPGTVEPAAGWEMRRPRPWHPRRQKAATKPTPDRAPASPDRKKAKAAA